MILGGSLRRPATPIARTLFDTAGLPMPAGTVGGFRLLNSAYMPGVANASKKCIRVRRASDNALLDIGFDSSGNLNTSAIATHCTGTTGYVAIGYSQSGDGHDIVFPTANQWIIYESGAIVTCPGSVKPAMRAPNATSGGVTNSFAAYTGTAVTGCFVGAISNGTASFSPRFASLLPSNTSLGDVDSTGAYLLSRDGGSTPTQNWAIQRGGTKQIQVAGTYGQLAQVTSQINGATYTLAVNGNSSSIVGTVNTAFNVGRIGIGYSGSAYISSTDEYLSEWIVWFTALSQTQIDLVRVDQRAYYGTPADPASSWPESAGFTLKTQEDFTAGAWRTSEWVIYNNGHMTNNAGAWKSSNVSVVQLTDAPYVGQYALEFRSKMNTTVQTLSDGFTYLLEGGAGYWKGPADGRYGAAFQEEGLWRAIYRWVGITATPTPSRGHGWADLLWPYETGALPSNWPIHTEPDVVEVFPGNTNKFGGESNWHLDTTKGSSRHQRQPPTSGTVSQYPNLFTGVPAGDISAQNYGIDWTDWHTVDCVIKVGGYGEVVIDGTSHGRINYTASNPAPFVDHSGNASDGTAITRPKRRTIQIEGLGIPDSQRQPGTFALQVKSVAFYSLP